MKVKITGNEGTITRLIEEEDCDNYWIAVKPADSVVFDEVLMGDCKVDINKFEFSLHGGRDRNRRGLP
jgi:hypothetical protein